MKLKPTNEESLKSWDKLTDKQKDKAYKKFVNNHRLTIICDLINQWLFDKKGNSIRKKPIRF